jgi:uncharacterized membrane protein YvbJ
MFCRKCGEENPENAVFCRNCGERLEKEEVKKTEVIENEVRTNYNDQQSTTGTSSKDDSNWTSCCLCIIAVFIVFAILGVIFR